jgi:hypothetical protein
VRLHLDHRRGLAGAGVGGLAEARVADVRPVAARPAIVGAVADVVDLFRRALVAHMVAAVVGRVEAARPRLPGEADRVAQALGVDPTAAAVGVVLEDRRPMPVALIADVAGGADRDVELAVRPERDRPRPVLAALRQVGDDHRLAV